jgi:hypothetical protein
MGLISHLCSFAVGYAATFMLADLVSVYWLDRWDRKWTQDANVQITLYLLPVAVAVASLSCFVRARKYIDWLNRRWMPAIWSGVASGILAAGVENVPYLVSPQLFGWGYVAPLIFLATPALSSYLVLWHAYRTAERPTQSGLI